MRIYLRIIWNQIAVITQHCSRKVVNGIKYMEEGINSKMMKMNLFS